ncbi:hypothetical protein B1H10_00675 [candidate division KSB1 bacterium 4484_188]|nr:MAG: hypothetical protein B1H10_00675 [candidate division KSB1 bacterium 4484_188]HFE63398.1 PAS domain S-box protein [Caldithrix sp.]
MAARNYIKIVVNHPRRELFGFLQQNILCEDVEMFYFPNVTEIGQFLRRISPHILLVYVDREVLVNKKILEFFQLPFLKDVWILFIVSPQINLSQMEILGKFERSLVLHGEVKPDVVAYNIRTLLWKEQEEREENANRLYAQNLLNCSKIISQEDSISSVFESLINFLPKFLVHDYWAFFTYDPEFSRVMNFHQFIPPHRRNIAILTPNLEKLAEIWLKQNTGFRVNISDDPKLFRKLGEWGWGIKQLHFLPLMMGDLPLGGMILGNTNQMEVEQRDLDFLDEISGLLSQKIYNLLRTEKEAKGFDDFAEQLIYNRFSEDAILQLGCKKINEVVQAENTIFWQINLGFGFVFPKFSYAKENYRNWEALEKNMIFLAENRKLAQLFSGDKAFLINDVENHGHFSDVTIATFKKLNYTNLLIAPVRIENEEVGVFIANRSQINSKFSAWEIDRVNKLMEKIIKVLEDTHVVKEANLKLKQLSKIFELGNEIKLDLNIEEMLTHITRSVRYTLGWNDVAVLQSNPYQKVHRLSSKIGFDSVSELSLNILEDLSFETFEKFLLSCSKISQSYFYDSHPVNINGDALNYIDEMMTEWHPQDLLIVPIETHRRGLGYLVVRDPVDRLKPNEDRVLSLEYFANQAAVAIENSILYENLLASEERYRSLAETMTLALVTCSPEGKIVYVNPAFEHLVGFGKKAISGKSLFSFFSNDSQKTLREIIRTIMRRKLRDGKNIENVELELLSKKDKTIPVSTYAFPFYQQRHKIGAFLVLNDLRVVKKLEQLKSDFNSMIVHDLRSPMNVIQGFIELIRTRVVGEINSEQEELLDIAKENVKKVLTLVDNFLVASKMEVGKFSIEPKVGEIHSLINRIVENHRVLLKNKNISLKSKLNQNLPLLYFDSLRIEQVLNNLLSNAIKFTPEGKTIRVTTEFHQKEIKGEKKMFAKVGVHDTGPGIPPEKMKQVFNKYEQVDSETAMKSAGTGLGLSICKEIIGLHGGDIWVESEVGKGSHFYFTLPIEPSIEKFLK